MFIQKGTRIRIINNDGLEYIGVIKEIAVKITDSCPIRTAITLTTEVNNRSIDRLIWCDNLERIDVIE